MSYDLQSTLLQNMNTSLYKEEYENAYFYAQQIQVLSRNTNVDNRVLQITNQVLSFIKSQNLMFQNIPADNKGCPADTVPVQVDENGKATCPDSTTPIFAGKFTQPKCCRKMSTIVQETDETNHELYEYLKKNKSDVFTPKLANEFQTRLGLNDNKELKQMKDDLLLSDNIPSRTINFMTGEESAHEEKKLLQDLEDETKKTSGQPWILLGMSSGLYYVLKSTFRTTKGLVKWYVNNDWSRYWIILMIIRVVMVMSCIILKLSDGAYFLDELAKQYFGLRPIAMYTVYQLGPTVIALIAFNSLFAGALTNSAAYVMTSLSQGLMGALGSLFSVTFLQYRLLSLTSSLGFLYDLKAVLWDFWAILKASGKTLIYGRAGNKLLQGDVVGAGKQVIKSGMEAFCLKQLDSTISKSSKLMRSILLSFLKLFCAYAPFSAKNLCESAIQGVEKIFDTIVQPTPFHILS